MKATGIIRRIDDLGRVVIPREIRRQLGIRDGDPLEIYTDARGVYFERYNGREEELKAAFQPMWLALYKTGYVTALYCDRQHQAGSHFTDKEFLDLTHMSCGVWGGYEWTIGFNSDHFVEETFHMLQMMAMSLREAAREIYGEE
jgi:AbrB family looped-hinge helix DNA binding protein